MPRPDRTALAPLAPFVLLACLVAGCSSTPTGSARERFVAQLQQPGTHRYDQVQVGTGSEALDAANANCVADAFERNRWSLQAALDGKVPAQLDVKKLNRDINACRQDPGTTLGPFGRSRLNTRPPIPTPV